MRYALAICTALAIASPAAAAPFAYATTNDGDFGVLDLGSGAYVHCGYTGTLLVGLAVGQGGALYGMDTANFYRVNPHTGAVTSVAGAGNYRVALGSAAHVIYTVDSNASLYTIDPQTGAQTAVGGGAPGFVFVLSGGAPTLFESAARGFYEYFPRQGVAHRKDRDLSIEWGAIAWVNEVLYGIGEPRFELTQYVYTINAKDGSTTQIATIPITVNRIMGIAPAAPDNTGACRVSSSAASTASQRY
jgi:hypothetical protein